MHDNIQISAVIPTYVMDTGTHIISSMGYETPATYEDVFKILGEDGVLPRAFVKKLKGLAGLRNILVRGYMDIDLDQVYAHLNKIGLFEEYSQYIARFLKHESRGGSHSNGHGGW